MSTTIPTLPTLALLPTVTVNTIPQRTFAAFITELETAWAYYTGLTPSLSSGDPLLALFQTFSSQLEFIESLAAWITAYSRAQTSAGAALDNWMAQFGYYRPAATFAFGQETFYTATLPAPLYIPVGAIVQTSNGSIQYQVIADTTNSAYSSLANAYIMPTGSTSQAVTIQALVGGTIGNVASGQLTSLITTLPGVIAVSNVNAISNGADSADDATFRQGFTSFIANLKIGTRPGILGFLNTTYTNLTFSLIDNELVNGTPQAGTFLTIVSSADSTVINEISNGLNDQVAFGIQFNVIAANTVTANIAISLSAAAANGNTASALETAITNYISAIPQGNTLYIMGLSSVLLNNGVLPEFDSSATTINGTSADLSVATTQIIVAGTVTVTIA